MEDYLNPKVKCPKFLVGMVLTSIVHMHDPQFKAKVKKTATGYEITDICRSVPDGSILGTYSAPEKFPENDPELLDAICDALIFLKKKAEERKNRPDWPYPI